MLGVPEAARTIFGNDFDPQAAEMTDPAVQTILNFTETIATLVKHDLLDRDLVDDWIWIAGFWERVAPTAERARTQTGAASLYKNVEALVSARG